jgi:hypothetical protein
MFFDCIILGLLVAEVIVLSRLDRRRFGTWATPFTLLGYPYTVVVILAYFLSPVFEFVPVYISSVVVWMVGLFLVWAAGSFLSWALLDMRLATGSGEIRFQPEPRLADDDAARRIAIPLAWASMPLMLYGAMAAARGAGGWSEIGSQEFRDAYSFGLPAHAVVLAMLLTIVLIGLYRRGDRIGVITIAMLLVFLTLGRVKGTILQAIIGGLVFRMLRGRFRVTFKKLAAVAAVTYILFNIVYLIGMSVFLSDDPFNGDIYLHLGRHYIYYLFAGVLAFSEAMVSGISDIGGDWHAIFAPFLNVYHAVFGGSLIAAGSSLEKGMDTDLLSDAPTETNVYTIFGTLHLYLGPFGAILYIVVIGLLCYGFLILVKRERNIWLTASYCLIAAQFTLGFFELYFWHLTTYEVIAMAALLGFFSRFKGWASARGQTALG